MSVIAHDSGVSVKVDEDQDQDHGVGLPHQTTGHKASTC